MNNNKYQIFLSIITVVRNNAKDIENIIGELKNNLNGLVNDYEIIIIDNNSTDDTLSILENLLQKDNFSNIQVFSLGKEVDIDTAKVAGIENSLGDYIAIYDHNFDDPGYIKTMLENMDVKIDIILAKNLELKNESLVYKILSNIYFFTKGLFSSEKNKYEIINFILINRKTINYLLQYQSPLFAFRNLIIRGGFSRKILKYKYKNIKKRNNNITESINKGIKLILFNTNSSVKFITILCFFGLLCNIFYSFYVFFIFLFKEDIEKGWVSASLQQSGMFGLISLVLLIMNEYLSQILKIINKEPNYFINKEIISKNIESKINIEEVDSS